MRKGWSKENLNPIIQLKKRNISNKYYLIDRLGTQQQVCLNFLLNCMQISKKKMFSVTKTITSNETAHDERGNFPTRKTSESDIAFVKEFIKRFPAYESHYRQSHTSIKYLSPFLNIQKMYREYCLKYEFYKKVPLKNWNFRNIFNTEFNLSFARLKVDTCRTCDRLKALSQSQAGNVEQHENIEKEKKEHHNSVQEMNDELRNTIEFASNPDNRTEAFTFDLQRALETPYIQTSEAFYKRQLWCYNLAIYDEVKTIGYMYIFLV